jgi:hypothetical protein
MNPTNISGKEKTSKRKEQTSKVHKINAAFQPIPCPRGTKQENMKQ